MDAQKMMPHSNCWSMVALIACYLILVLPLISTCQATSSPIVDGPGLVKSTGKDVVGSFGENDAIRSIISQVSSWMKEQKHVEAKQDIDDDDEDILLKQQRVQEPLPRPFVTLAYAQTLDGMIAAKNPNHGETTTSNLALSSPESFLLSHHLRNMHDAILIGGTTFLLDKPRLNVRLPLESTTNGAIEDPMPIVLDTHLDCLQQLLYNKIVSNDSSSQSSKEKTLPDIVIDKIRAQNPIICCSSHAAISFLDTLEIFQEQQITKRKKKNTYKITVFKKIDHYDDTYLPIKITIQITRHNKKQEEDITEVVTLTLLPCAVHEDGTKTKKSHLDLRHVLDQLYSQFDIESVMVEGGAGILSSFMNQCVMEDDGVRDSGSLGTVVDCICITIAPKIIGGKWGLPVLGGLDVLQRGDGDKHSAKVDSSDGDEGDDASDREVQPGMMAISEGRFVSLGPDCTFLGRI